MWYVIAVPVVAIGIGIMAIMLSGVFKSDKTAGLDQQRQPSGAVDESEIGSEEKATTENGNPAQVGSENFENRDPIGKAKRTKPASRSS